MDKSLMINQIKNHLGYATDSEFARELAITPQTLSNWKSRNTWDAELIYTKCERKINPEWLLTGEGDISSIPVRKEPNVAHAIRDKSGIPLIPASAVAGYGSGEVSIAEHDILERYLVPDFSGADFMIHVSGNSMQPKYNSGDVIACKIIRERNFFQWGRVFVLHHKDQGIMVKRLFPSDQGKVICRSDNRDYPDFTLDLEEITDIALVMGAIVVD